MLALQASDGAGWIEALAGGLSGGRAETEARAIVMTALFAGGVSIARAVRRSERRDHIARILRDAVIACARGSRSSAGTMMIRAQLPS